LGPEEEVAHQQSAELEQAVHTAETVVQEFLILLPDLLSLMEVAEVVAQVFLVLAVQAVAEMVAHQPVQMPLQTQVVVEAEDILAGVTEVQA
jgi:hypothetical protein